jgi:hypothetical protein
MENSSIDFNVNNFKAITTKLVRVMRVPSLLKDYHVNETIMHEHYHWKYNVAKHASDVLYKKFNTQKN